MRSQTAGETEQPEVTELDDGIQATFNGFSPVSISWKETAQTDPIVPSEQTDKPEAPYQESTTETGNDINMLPLIIAAATAAMIGAGAILGRRRRT